MWGPPYRVQQAVADVVGVWPVPLLYPLLPVCWHFRVAVDSRTVLALVDEIDGLDMELAQHRRAVAIGQ